MRRLKRILIVDDQTEVTSTLKIGLEDQGCSVSASNFPRQVVSNFKPGTYDIAIVDIRMPDMNGFDLYRELRKRDSQIIIWFFTAFEIKAKEFNKMFPELQVHQIIRKPVSISDLAHRINGVAEVKQNTPIKMK